MLNIDLNKVGIKGYTWPFTQDHAKWGIAEKKKPGWVIIGDINRQVSQDKRGGGALAFQNEVVWNLLRRIEVKQKVARHGAQKEHPNRE